MDDRNNKPDDQQQTSQDYTELPDSSLDEVSGGKKTGNFFADIDKVKNAKA